MDWFTGHWFIRDYLLPILDILLLTYLIYKTYQILVERSGDELTVEGEGQRHRVHLLREPAGEAAAPATGQREGQRAPTVPKVTPAAPVAATPIAAAPAAPAAVHAAPAPSGGNSAGALLAPMTGVVKEIRVSVGHNVQKGQVVLVMEAMKMDIDVPTPTAGIVAEVSVRAGESVSAKQQLLVVH